MASPVYKRILLKVSGESLSGTRGLVSTTSFCMKSETF
jgi:uridylate kinase